MNDDPTPIGTVELLVKDQYGSTVFHPHNDAAKHIAAIAGTKTLTLQTIEHAMRLGFEVHYIHPQFAPPRLNTNPYEELLPPSI